MARSKDIFGTPLLVISRGKAVVSMPVISARLTFHAPSTSFLVARRAWCEDVFCFVCGGARESARAKIVR